MNMDITKTGLQSVLMPTSGLGCWQSSKGEVGQAVKWAIEGGVRMIDTAYMYQNEDEIGEALKEVLDSGIVKREDLFIVTKLPMMAMNPEDVEPYFESSRKSLGLDYVDLYLVHGPVGVVKDEETRFMKFLEGGKVKFEHHTDLLAIWKEMEKLVDSGKVRSIGVSNYNSVQLEKTAAIARIPIAVNQIECNVYFQQKKVRETMEKLGIKVMAYAPLGSPGRPGDLANLMGDDTIVALAERHGKTPAQVLVRYLLQLGFICIPKSVKQHRIQENFNVYDFNLSETEMLKLKAMDRGSKRGRSFTFSFLQTDDDVLALKEYPIIDRDEY